MLDLHCHSTCSDGTDAPEVLAGLAGALGLTAVALTDHDAVAGFERFSTACSAVGVRPVRAAEISCLEEGRSTHVLCYFISDDESSELRRLLGDLAGDRRRRNELLIAKLAELGYGDVTYEEVVRSAGGDEGSIGRPHFADALLRCYPGRFAGRQEVFDQLLGSGGAAYVPKARVDVAQASKVAGADGALTVLAHPIVTFFGGAPPEDRDLGAVERRLEGVLSRLRADGLSGLECYYPTHDPATTELLVSLARRHDLVPTGGSDYHGTNKPGLGFAVGYGDLRVPDEALEALEALRA